MTRASAKLDRSRVSGEGSHYVASFFVPLPTTGMNSYDLCNFFYTVILLVILHEHSLPKLILSLES